MLAQAASTKDTKTALRIRRLIFDPRMKPVWKMFLRKSRGGGGFLYSPKELQQKIRELEILANDLGDVAPVLDEQAPKAARRKTAREISLAQKLANFRNALVTNVDFQAIAAAGLFKAFVRSGTVRAITYKELTDWLSVYATTADDLRRYAKLLDGLPDIDRQICAGLLYLASRIDVAKKKQMTKLSRHTVKRARGDLVERGAIKFICRAFDLYLGRMPYGYIATVTSVVLDKEINKSAVRVGCSPRTV